MHFNPAFPFVIARDMLKGAQIEIRSQLAIHAAQQVEIKGSRDAGRIVISRNQTLAGLNQIGAQQQ